MKELDITPGEEIFEFIQNIEGNAWKHISEYVDNSVSSFISNEKALKKIDPNYQLDIRISRDKANNRITITDNAGGISDKDLARAVRYKRPPPGLPLNEHGVGMKNASFWFTETWSIRTSAIGETKEKTIHFSIPDIRKFGPKAPISERNVSSDLHLTEITLENCRENRFPIKKTVPKIQSVLSSNYRRFLERSDVQITWIEEDEGKSKKIIWKTPKVLHMQFVNDPEGQKRKWIERISFKRDSYEIEGWIAILAKAHGPHAGLALLRRGRVIEGGDYAWMPDSDDYPNLSLFGGTHSYQRSRLFGELDLKGFPVNTNKNKIEWPEDIKHEFIKYLINLVRNETNKSKTILKDFWIQMENYVKSNKELKQNKPIRKHDQKINTDIERQLKEEHKNTQISKATHALNKSVDKSNSHNNNPKQLLEFDIQLTDKKLWKIKILLVDEESDGKWFHHKSKEISGYPKEIKISINENHPYTIELFPSEDVYISRGKDIFKIISYMCIMEEIAKLKGTDHTVKPSYITSKFNDLLSSLY